MIDCVYMRVCVCVCVCVWVCVCVCVCVYQCDMYFCWLNQKRRKLFAICIEVPCRYIKAFRTCCTNVGGWHPALMVWVACWLKASGKPPDFRVCFSISRQSILVKLGSIKLHLFDPTPLACRVESNKTCAHILRQGFHTVYCFYLFCDSSWDKLLSQSHVTVQSYQFWFAEVFPQYRF